MGMGRAFEVLVMAITTRTCRKICKRSSALAEDLEVREKGQRPEDKARLVFLEES